MQIHVSAASLFSLWLVSGPFPTRPRHHSCVFRCTREMQQGQRPLAAEPGRSHSVLPAWHFANRWPSFQWCGQHQGKVNGACRARKIWNWNVLEHILCYITSMRFCLLLGTVSDPCGTLSSNEHKHHCRHDMNSPWNAISFGLSGNLTGTIHS